VLRALLDFHRVVDNQVHELVETTDFSLDTHSQLLEEPDLYSAVLLQELEDEVDGREEHFVAASALASGHGCEGLLMFGLGVVVGGEVGSWSGGREIGFMLVVRCRVRLVFRCARD
jgi:hypothetical protein